MNSYNKPRNMSYKGTRKQAMPALKLMAIENEYHRTKDALEHEIKRLRGEVGVLAKRYNGAKKEIEDLVRRVRSQPPPPIPKRDDETERRREEWIKRWQEHLEEERKKEEKEEEEKKRKKEAQLVPTENEIIMLDSDLTQPKQPSPPPSQIMDNKTNDQPNPSDEPAETHLVGNGSDTEMVLEQEEEPKKKGKKKAKKEKKKQVEEMRISMPKGMMGVLMRMEEGKREEEYSKRAKRWEEMMITGKLEDTVVDMRWLREEAKKVLEDAKGGYRCKPAVWWDVIFYAKMRNPGWSMEVGEGEWILRSD